MKAKAAGEIGPDVVAVGPWWRDGEEIDAVVLAGRRRAAVLVGEAKWTRSLDGTRTALALERRSEGLPRRAPGLRLALCARDEVRNAPPASLLVTAREIFSP